MAKLVREIKDVAKGWRWGRRTMTPRSALDSTPPPKIWSYPTDWARTAAGRAARDVILDAALKPIIWNETTPEVFGLDNLEGVKGPVMFISNHSSHLDASIILTTLPHSWREKTATAAAKDYFFDVWWRSAFTALVYAGFPVERGAGEKATSKAKELIREGWNIIVFPEGTRSTDGWLQRFRHGTSRLALDMKMPVVPIAIVGAYAAMPKGRSWPRKGRPPIRVRYGRPIVPARGRDAPAALAPDAAGRGRAVRRGPHVVVGGGAPGGEGRDAEPRRSRRPRVAPDVGGLAPDPAQRQAPDVEVTA